MLLFRASKPIICVLWCSHHEVGWKGDRWIPASVETSAGERWYKHGVAGINTCLNSALWPEPIPKTISREVGISQVSLPYSLWPYGEGCQSGRLESTCCPWPSAENMCPAFFQWKSNSTCLGMMPSPYPSNLKNCRIATINVWWIGVANRSFIISAILFLLNYVAIRIYKNHF